jgi:hypothetical protein
MTIPAIVGQAVTLAEILEDGNESVYPQAEIYSPGSSTPIISVDLDHIAKGRYEGQWTPTTIGTYVVLFIVYSDIARTIENIVYTREAEQIFVSQSGVDDLASAITRILGLTHENAFIDNTTYDINDQLLQARIRIFESRASAQAATDGGSETIGLLATYNMETTYEAFNRMGTYRMVKQ